MSGAAALDAVVASLPPAWRPAPGWWGWAAAGAGAGGALIGFYFGFRVGVVSGRWQHADPTVVCLWYCPLGPAQRTLC